MVRVFAFELPLSRRLVAALWGHLALVVAARPQAGKQGSLEGQRWTGGPVAWR